MAQLRSGASAPGAHFVISGGSMKNLKRAAAILGIIILLAVCCLPMIFAFGSGEGSEGMFRASIGIVIIVPVLAYAFWMVFGLLNKKNKETKSSMKNIIFDVGQVLVKFDWEGYLKSFGFPEEEYRAMAENIFLSPLWNERDRGELTEEEYIRRFQEAVPQYKEDVRKVLENTAKTIFTLDYAETWTKYLKSQGYHLFILSNYCEYTLEQTRPMMTFLKYMDGIVFSCKVKQIKPEPDIYKTLLTEYNLNPEESVFLDDREENCQTARSLGIHAICFKNFKQAAAELEKLGVK